MRLVRGKIAHRDGGFFRRADQSKDRDTRHRLIEHSQPSAAMSGRFSQASRARTTLSRTIKGLRQLKGLKNLRKINLERTVVNDK
jgi:hypothetical protein